jgi:hypothetical protein
MGGRPARNGGGMTSIPPSRLPPTGCPSWGCVEVSPGVVFTRGSSRFPGRCGLKMVGGDAMGAGVREQEFAFAVASRRIGPAMATPAVEVGHAIGSAVGRPDDPAGLLPTVRFMVPERLGSASERTSARRAAVPNGPPVQDINRPMALTAGSLVPGFTDQLRPTAKPVFGRGVSPAAPDCWPP